LNTYTEILEFDFGLSLLDKNKLRYFCEVISKFKQAQSKLDFFWGGEEGKSKLWRIAHGKVSDSDA